MRRKLVAASLLTALGGCTAEPVWAPEDQVLNALYRHGGPASLSLITVINNRSGGGAHTALLINGSQRVIWDPAGTWWNPRAPERNDLHYGMTPQMVETYIDYHTRQSFRTVVQEIPVTPEIAEQALQSAAEYGAAPKAFCTISTARILAKLPGFETTPQVLFPNRLRDAFANRPGVTTRVYRDDDADDNSGLLPQS